MKIDLALEDNNIDTGFLRIATELMNNWILKTGNESYRICEIEFYLKSESHNDTFVHGHDLQKEMGRWYLHGSGLDLTFGSHDTHRSILIRAIYNLRTGNYTYGPINIVTEIFSNFPSIYETSFTFGLVQDVNKIIAYEAPISAPRVGLNVKEDIEDMNGKNYRFLVMPKKKHIDKEKIAKAMKEQNYTDVQIRNIWG